MFATKIGDKGNQNFQLLFFNINIRFGTLD